MTEPITIKDIAVDEKAWYISLVQLLAGKAIKDITGYLSAEFGEDEVVFHIHEIIFEDGTRIGVSADYDFPYVNQNFGDTQPNMDDETLTRLYLESQEDEDDLTLEDYYVDPDSYFDEYGNELNSSEDSES